MLETLLVFAAFSALGVFGMAPSVTFGDSGEFAASAATLSLPHSPGYPLFVLMGNAFGKLIPWGNWALRTNLLSALMGAGALALLHRALREVGSGRLAALAGVLFLGFSPLWRYESAVTEVFALNGLVLAGLLWVVARCAARLWAPRPMAAMGLLFGLGLSNHHTLVLVLPAVFYQAWKSWSLEDRAQRAFLSGVGLFCLFAGLGMLCYLFLPLRSLQDPPLDWGNPTSLSRFMRVLLRKDYGSFSLTTEGPSALSRWGQVMRYMRFTLEGLGWTPLLLGALGFAAWPSLKLRLGWEVLLLWIVVSGPFFLVLGNPGADALTTAALERFYLASWLGVAFLISGGVEYLTRLWKPLAIPLLAGAAIAGWATRGEWIAREDFAAYDYGRSILKTLPRDSSLYIDGGDDTFYTLAYLSYAQGMRPDLDVHDRGGLVFRNPYGSDFRSIPKEHKEARRLSVEGPLARRGSLYYSTLKENIIPGFTLAPLGLLKRPVAEGRLPGLSPDPWTVTPRRWSEDLLRRHYRDRALVAFEPFMRAADLRRRERFLEALGYLGQAWETAPDALWTKPNLSHLLSRMGYELLSAGRWSEAEKALRLGIRVDPELPYFPMHLGVAYEKLGRLPDAEASYREALRLKPDWVKAYHNLGTLYWGQERWEQAAGAFEAAMLLSPGDPGLKRFALAARRKAGG